MILVDISNLLQWFLGEGLPYFVLIIVLLAGLFVFVFITTLFPTLRTIIAFAYLNSLISVLTRKTTSKEFLENLSDSRDMTELIQKLREININIEPSEDPAEIENALVKHFTNNLRLIEKYSPEISKPFVDAFMKVLLVEELIKAIRSALRGFSPDITILKDVSPEIAKHIENVKDFHSLRAKLIELGIALPEDPVEAERTLMVEAIEKLKESSRLVDESISNAVLEFVLHYKDFNNILLILRGKALGLDSTYIESLTLGEGMYLNKWLLHRLSESGSLDEIMTELQGTPYGQELRGISTTKKERDLSLIEAAITRAFFKTIISLEHKYSLTVGPLLRYLLSCRLELRNLRLIVYGIAEELSRDRLMQLAIYG